MTDDDLPLWTAAEARERRAGIRPVDPPPLQKAPKKPKRRRRPKREPEAPPTATITILPLHRNERELRELNRQARRIRADKREGWMADELARRARQWQALGASDEWVRAELVRVIDRIVDLDEPIWRIFPSKDKANDGT